jgi:hypothetical protein
MPQLRTDDPGALALFTEPARFRSWLDVEAALALAQAELSIIPEAAARKIVRKAHLSYLDLAAVREGLARTGCGSGSRGGRCPSLADYVTGSEARHRATAAGWR